MFGRYLKGRLTYEKFIEVCDAVSSAFTQKYKILSSKPSGMSDVTLRKYKVFKEQECEVSDGSKFIATAEFKSLDLTLDATTKTALAVLKHTGALKVETSAANTWYKLPTN